MSLCPCGSFLPERNCCEPIIRGTAEATTALALMRSRYTAFTKGSVKYLFQTYVQEWRESHPFERFDEQFQQFNWQELEIVGVYEGGTHHETGEVEFVAHYEYRGARLSLHERSSFRKEKGVWRYVGVAVAV